MFNEKYDMSDVSEEYFEEEPGYSKKNKRRGVRRKRDWQKAKRKQKIDLKSQNFEGAVPWYDNLHQYSKNKIHCSCCLCRGKDYHGRHILTNQEVRSMDEFKVELAEVCEDAYIGRRDCA